MVSSLSPDLAAYNTNLALLETAHSIFARWRSEIRTDALFTTINYVLARFVDPFLAVFRHTASTLLKPESFAPGGPLAPGGGSAADKGLATTVAQVQVVLLDIFHDLTCQDIPPAIEDAQKEFFGQEQGWLVLLLAWEPELLKGEVCVYMLSLSSSFSIILDILRADWCVCDNRTTTQHPPCPRK